MKSILTLVVVAVVAFVVIPRIVADREKIQAQIQNVATIIEDQLEKIPVSDMRAEISKSIPLIVKTNERTSRMTVPGVLLYTNAARDINGKLSALGLDLTLNNVAEIRLKDMFAKQYFEHYSPTGIGAPEVAKDLNFEYILIGENIALGNFKDDEAIVKAWMASPGHRANILNTHYTQIGIAVGKGTYKDENTWIGIQVFARPSSLCPSVNKDLKIKIDAYQQVLVTIKAQAEKEGVSLKVIDTSTTEGQQSYNTQINDYNNLVSQVNKTIAELKNYIASYNTQIKSYNTCIKL